MEVTEVMNGIDSITGLTESTPAKWIGYIAKGYIQNKEMIQIFVNAGKDIGNYEYDGSEESELRRIIFCEENMKVVAEYMMKCDEFSWLDTLQQCVRHLLSGNEMDAKNKEICEKHFCQIIENEIKEHFRSICMSSYMKQTRDNTEIICGDIQEMGVQITKVMEAVMLNSEALQKMREEQLHSRQEKTSRNSTYKITQTAIFGYEFERNAKELKWQLSRLCSFTMKTSPQEQIKDVIRLTEVWENERKAYPGWYIAPYGIRQTLEMYSKTGMLLTSLQSMQVGDALRFCYEFMWRLEQCQCGYGSYEKQKLAEVWCRYYQEIRQKGQQPWMEQWFYIGQALLRQYREDGDFDQWKEMFDILEQYRENGTDGEAELKIERAKMAYAERNISRLRRELAKCRFTTMSFAPRLQKAGLLSECGMENEALHEIADMQKELLQEIRGDIEMAYRIYLMSLYAASLQLQLLSMEAVARLEHTYETQQETIDTVIRRIEACENLFHWETEVNIVQQALMCWQDKKFSKSEPFELNRVSYTFMCGSDVCEEAYVFYRIMDRLALPLSSGLVTMVSSMERVWFRALLDISYHVALTMLVRGTRSETVKSLISHEHIGTLDYETCNACAMYLIRVLETNLEELGDDDDTGQNALLNAIVQNVPELLLRFISRCSDEVQMQGLRMIKKLMEIPVLPQSFPTARLLVGLLKQISEKNKACMLGELLTTKIYEHRNLMGHQDAIDIFDYYFSKEDTRSKLPYCKVKEETIAYLLSEPDTLYKWRTKVARLETLQGLGLLTEEQQAAYGKLLWKYVDEKTNLPNLPNMHLFFYEQMPAIGGNELRKSVKAFFLNQTLSEQFKDEDGWRISMGSITYLDELRSLCIALENGYWSLEEAEVLIQNIIGYWPVLHGKLDKNATREKTMFSNAGYQEFEVRAIGMIRTLSALIDSLTVPLGEKSKADIRNMCNEMKEYGVATSELELYLLKDDELEAFVADIRTSLGGENENAIIDALRAASVLMKKYPESSAAKKLLKELLNLFHYRKTTGLVSVIWILHNLVYEHSGLITAKIVRELDGNLFTFSQLESYSKEQIAAQKACAALAYRLKLWKPKYCGAGVDAWEKLCSGEIWNEVKNEWLDK